MPQSYPVVRVARPLLGPKRGPLVKGAIDYREKSGAHLAQEP